MIKAMEQKKPNDISVWPYVWRSETYLHSVIEGLNQKAKKVCKLLAIVEFADLVIWRHKRQWKCCSVSQ